jgi:hypothetical protein
MLFKAGLRRASVILVALAVCGCVTVNSAYDVTKAIDPNINLPTRAQIDKELRGCGYSLQTVGTDLRREHPQKFHPWPDEVYERLLALQITEAFRRSGIGLSDGPACQVSITITEAKFGNEGLIAFPSEFASTVRVSKPSGEPILAFPMETGWVSTTTVILPGIVGSFAIPREGPGAHAYEITAMAILITRVLSGLREGKTFEEIELEKEKSSAKPRSDWVVTRGRGENNPWGLAPFGERAATQVAESIRAEQLQRKQ